MKETRASKLPSPEEEEDQDEEEGDKERGVMKLLGATTCYEQDVLRDMVTITLREELNMPFVCSSSSSLSLPFNYPHLLSSIFFPFFLFFLGIRDM